MKNDKTYLRHIIDAIGKAREYVAGKSYDEFTQNSLIVDGVVRELEIIGEASSNITEAFQEAHLEIPWSRMIGMRNRLIHEYFGVDKKVVWDTVANDLPELRKDLEYLLS